MAAENQVFPDAIIPAVTTMTLDRKRRLRPYSMSKFTAHYETPPATEYSGLIRSLIGCRTVEFHVTNDLEIVAHMIAYCVAQSNSDDSNDFEKCALYMSILNGYIPSLQPLCVKTLGNMGCQVTLIHDNNRDNKFIEYEEGLDIENTAVILGESVLLLFKNIAEVSYNNFMKNRARAMKEVTGVEGSLLPDGEDVYYTLETASTIRQKLGVKSQFRAAVLKALMDSQNRPDPIGLLCRYLCNILAFTDMAPLVFIHEALLMTRSPIINHPQVSGEVRALKRAFRMINQFEHPEYFMILAERHQVLAVERAKFPNLLAIAQKYRSKIYKSVSKFAFSTGRDVKLIDELFKEHELHMNGITRTAISHRIDYLQNYDSDEEDPLPSKRVKYQRQLLPPVAAGWRHDWF